RHGPGEDVQDEPSGRGSRLQARVVSPHGLELLPLRSGQRLPLLQPVGEGARKILPVGRGNRPLIGEMPPDAFEESAAQLLPGAVAVEDDGNALFRDEISLIPERTLAVLGAAVSGPAEHVAAAGPPDEQRLVFADGALAGPRQADFPGNG